MEIGGEDIEFLLMIMVLEKRTFKRHKSKKTTFPYLFNWEWV